MDSLLQRLPRLGRFIGQLQDKGVFIKILAMSHYIWYSCYWVEVCKAVNKSLVAFLLITASKVFEVSPIIAERLIYLSRSAFVLYG